MSSVNWQPLLSLFREAESFLITSHVRPDADALGSERGLASILAAMGKSVTIINASAAPTQLEFMTEPNAVLKLGQDIPRTALPKTDVIVVVDTSAWQQLGTMAEAIRGSEARRVVIDHHISGDDMEAMEFRDVTAAATGELIFQLAQLTGHTFDATTASWVFAAIATDTGWFRFPSTTQRTMKIAAELIRQGADTAEMYRLINEQRSPARVRLSGRVLSRIEVSCDGRLAWLSASKEDFEATGSVPADTESLVNEALAIKGIEAAFIAVELPVGKIKVSLRCRSPHNVAALAEEFGGGGHQLASGATLPQPLSEAAAIMVERFTLMLNRN